MAKSIAAVAAAAPIFKTLIVSVRVRFKKWNTKFCNNSSCWSINMGEKGDEWMGGEDELQEKKIRLKIGPAWDSKGGCNAVWEVLMIKKEVAI